MSYRNGPLVPEPPEEQGVQALIDRLKTQGVTAGQQQARALVEDAHAKAQKILAEAQQEAERIRQQAREKAVQEKAVGQEALRLACRDVLISLKNQISGLFQEVLGRQVSAEFQRQEFLQKLLLEICQRQLQTVPPDQPLTVLSPKPADTATDTDTALAQLILSLSQEGLGKGSRFVHTQETFHGFKVQVEGEQVTIDLSDEAVAALLKQYLLPRFRAVLEGYV